MEKFMENNKAKIPIVSEKPSIDMEYYILRLKYNREIFPGKALLKELLEKTR